MKRKIFSKLLMGAFLFASVSAFVSCKDYDDDINANKADIKAAQEQLATLTSNLTSLKSQVEAQKTALEKELAAAKSQLETQIADAKAQLSDAIAKKADQTTVDGLATKVATLESNLSALKAAYEAKIAALESALDSLKALIDKKADITYVDNAIATLQSVLEGKIAIVDQNKVSKDDFNAFKTEVSALQSALETLKALANGKADQKDLDNAVEKINEKLAALQKQMETVVPQSALEKMSETITGIRTSIDALSQTIAAKANQSALDELSARVDANYKELKAQANALVTPEQLAEAIAALKDEMEKKGDAKTAELEKAIADLEEALNKKIDGVEEAAAKNLADAVETINTALGTKANASDLENAIAEFREAKDIIVNDIATKYAAVTGDIAGINKTLGQIQETLETKAAQSDLEELGEAFAEFVILQGVTNGVLDNRLIACEALIEQVAAINTFLGELEEGATLAGKLAALKEQMSKEAQDALDKEIGNREKAIEDVTKAITDLETDLNDKIAKAQEDYNKKIEAANKNHEDLMKLLYGDGTEDEDATIGDINQLKKDFSQIDEKIQTGIDENLSNLMVFVQRMLNSISLVPQLYVDGIEAIEFTSLKYYAIQPGTSGLRQGYRPEDQDWEFGWVYENYKESRPLLVNNKPVEILTDNGLAEAYYRLNPATVARESIDEENIEYLAATAETRAATVKSPVEFNGIAEWNYKGKPGLVKINLRKTADFQQKSINRDDKGNIYIVALKVPRKANAEENVEAADIVSENSRLVETVKVPKIARLKWNVNETKNGYDPEDETQKKMKVHHYTDSVTMYNQLIEKNCLVYDSVNFNATYDVLSKVTGCDVSYADEGEHNQITKADLKKFGLTFRFHIPTKPYQDVEHTTDQQQFAAITETTGILSSKLPDGEVNNRACVGKEPIICIQLVDTVNNKLVDERYMKIKWIEPTKGTVTLDSFTDETVLKPCDANVSKGITWKDFITRVYAKADDLGLSQQTFEKVYPVGKVKVGSVLMYWEDGSNANQLEMLSPYLPLSGPNVDPTVNLQGDALIASWTLQPEQIANIYPHQSKTFVCTIEFVSQLRTEYPNLKLEYRWTITLPTLPSIEGYYDNYWFTKYTAHDVLPVQYNTALYNAIKNGDVIPGKEYGIDAPAVGMQKYDAANNTYFPETPYCVFYNNLTNVFKYHMVGANANTVGTPEFIVKNIGQTCGTWDLQFTMAGKDRITSKLYTQAKPGNVQYHNAYGQSPEYLKGTDWKTFGAYKLENAANAQALQLEWWGQYDVTADEYGLPDQDQKDHKAWDGYIDGKAKYNSAYLYADHHNAANQALLNKLDKDNEEDGWTPKRTHDANKAVHMGIWATLNDWNIIPVKDYDLYLVEPLRINATLTGCFEEGYVSGTCIKEADAFNMRDFRGYEVKNAAPTAAEAKIEQYKYQQALYKYYEVGTPNWDLDNVKYGMEVVTNADGTKEIKASETGKLSAADIKKYTNGNISLSIEQKTYEDVSYLVFKNNQGSNVEEEVWVYIPVSVDYGFGKVTEEVKVKLYPKGAGKGVPYPGGDQNARRR